MPIPSNKKYEKFWEDDKLDVSTSVDQTDTVDDITESNTDKPIVVSETIKLEEPKKVVEPKTTKKKRTTKKVETKIVEPKEENKPIKKIKVEPKKVETKIVEPKEEKVIEKPTVSKKVETKIIEPKEEKIIEKPKVSKKIETKIVEPDTIENVAVVINESGIDNIINSNKQETKIEQVIIETKNANVSVVVEEVVKETIPTSLKDIYNAFMLENKPFRMLHRGVEIFNTNKQVKKDYPVFQHDKFILFGKKFLFRGIRIEKI